MSHPIQEQLITYIGARLSANELGSLKRMSDEDGELLQAAVIANNFEDFIYRMSTEIGIFDYDVIDHAFKQLSQSLENKQQASPPISPRAEVTEALDDNEIAKKKENVLRFLEKLKVSREGTQVRIPAKLSRGGSAEGLLKRQHYMLTQKQVNFVRKMQLAAVFNSERSRLVRDKLERNESDVQTVPGNLSMASGIEISHRTNPDIFSAKDPRVLIGEMGEAVMLCVQAKLGEGAFGAVYIGQQLDTGEFCVIKNYHTVDDETKVEFARENATLEQLNMLIDTLNTSTLGQTKLMSTQELAWGEDLCKFLGIEEGRQNEHDLLKREEICIKALEAIHQMHVVNKKLHRDIKVENIMWDDTTRTVKLVDVGLTVDMNKQGKYVDDRAVGTPAYIAPELIRKMMLGDDCVYSEQTEAYAAGILACEIFSSDDLSLGQDELVGNIRFKGGKLFIKSGLTQSLAAADIFNPDKSGQRSDAEQQFYDEIKKLVEINTLDRAKIKDAIVNLKAIHEQHKKERVEVAAIQAPSNTETLSTSMNADLERELSEFLRDSIVKLNQAAQDALQKRTETESFKGKLILSASRTSSVDRQSIENFRTILNQIDPNTAITLDELNRICDALIDMTVAHKKQFLEGQRFSTDKQVETFIDISTQRINDSYRSTHEYRVGNQILAERDSKRESQAAAKPERNTL